MNTMLRALEELKLAPMQTDCTDVRDRLRKKLDEMYARMRRHRDGNTDGGFPVPDLTDFAIGHYSRYVFELGDVVELGDRNRATGIVAIVVGYGNWSNDELVVQTADQAAPRGMDMDRVKKSTMPKAFLDLAKAALAAEMAEKCPLKSCACAAQKEDGRAED